MPFDLVAPPACRDHLAAPRGRVAAALSGWRPLADPAARGALASFVQYFLCGLGIRGA